MTCPVERDRRTVRLVSALTAETARVSRRPTRRTGWPPTPPPPAARPATPLPPADLLAAARELRDLLGALTTLTGSVDAWGMRVLRRNVELALRWPATLERADNQLDFVEELAQALWDPGDSAFRHAARRVPSAVETQAMEAHRRAVLERLDGLAADLCARVEGWLPPGAGDPGREAAGNSKSPT
jgi:hypothetical protein